MSTRDGSAEDWEIAADAAAPRYRRLREILRGYGSVVIAYSGGCDSAFLLRVASEVLGSRALGLTAVGASLAPGERDAARRLAQEMGAAHIEIESHELENPAYSSNPANRCYHCKTELYDLAVVEAQRRGLAFVASGTNADELSDYRPGLQAAAEHQIQHPLVEAGLTKKDIRALSRRLLLRTWDKPQTPCLSSRLPYGTPVTRERLAMIDRAESALRAAGFRVFRVRHHELADGSGALARIELAAEELARAFDQEVRTRIHRDVSGAGYRLVTIDTEPFRSGRLNEAAGLVPLGGQRVSLTRPNVTT
jgi:uncharacterized protein